MSERTIFCIAPGPTVAEMDLSALRGRRVLAIKRGFKWAPWCEAVFSTHARKFYQDPETIAFRAAHPEKTYYAMRSEREGGGTDGVITLEQLQEFGLCKDPRGIGFGKNSGHGGINLAYHMLPEPKAGCAIVLIGYDMRHVGGRSHADRAQATAPIWQYRNIFVPAFNDIARDLEAEGVACVNATPDSALPQFRRVRLEDVL